MISQLQKLFFKNYVGSTSDGFSDIEREATDYIKKENAQLKHELKVLNTDFLKESEMREIIHSIADIPYSEKFFETMIHQVTLQKVDLPSKAREALDQKQGQINQLKLMLREIQSIKRRANPDVES